jgi:hypothetical protein
MEVTANGHRIMFWGNENILQLIVVLVVQPCEYTESYSLF